ncbi:MAG: phosphoribosyltransferase domain-containing protein [Clostridiaceae bacterium]|nr:phosphoribosyltransferase domain-containing protein [Clostridiaceae bacterium]
MEKTLETYSNSKREYVIDKNLHINLHIKKNRYKIPSEFLFSMAARKNTKREFLFVSRVIGKHLPMTPLALNLIGGILARSWLEERENILLAETKVLVNAFNYLQGLEIGQPTEISRIESAIEILKSPIKLTHKTLFIGFAETATGLSHAVFNSFSNSTYIHTTREDIKGIEASILFQEEHSHAMEHQLYPINTNIFQEHEDIVLIDDELTTGKTALNLINKIKGKSFGIISVLDFREKEQELISDSYNGKAVRICSLIKGTIRPSKTGQLDFVDKMDAALMDKEVTFKEIKVNKGNFIHGYIMETGRFGCTSEMHREFMVEVKNIAVDLKKLRIAGNCLCIGTEEFIYIPCAISSEMGSEIYFQSTTRSPIYVRNLPNYGINTKITFKTSEDLETQKYMYNIPKSFYKQVFMFSEKPLEEDKKEEFAQIFNHYNIKNVVFVSFQES